MALLAQNVIRHVKLVVQVHHLTAILVYSPFLSLMVANVSCVIILAKLVILLITLSA